MSATQDVILYNDGIQCDYTNRPLSINEFCKHVNKLNQKWWHDPSTGLAICRNHNQMLMLMVSEISEAMEGERKNLMDDKLPHLRMAVVEIADTVIRLADFVGGFNVKTNFSIYASNLKRFHSNSDKGEMLFELVKTIANASPDYSATMSMLLNDCEDYCKILGYDLWPAIWQKLEYNKNREDHKAEARLRADGKKW